MVFLPKLTTQTKQCPNNGGVQLAKVKRLLKGSSWE